MNKRILKKTTSLTLCAVMLFGASSEAKALDGDRLTQGTTVTSSEVYSLAPGITETELTLNNENGSNQVRGYALEVELDRPGTKIVASYADFDASGGWAMQRLRDQAYAAEEKLGVNVIGGINGDFYNMGTGAPTGTFVMNGTVYNVNNNWAYFAIMKDGTPKIGRGSPDTENMLECVGGPAVLIENGEYTNEVLESAYGVDQLPRTAIGYTADNKVVMFVADGRQDPISCGQTFKQLADTMLAFGCVEAMSLDGGGSATFISQRQTDATVKCRSTSSDGVERKVSSSLLVYSQTESDGEFYSAELYTKSHAYRLGEKVKLYLTASDAAGGAANLPEGVTLALADEASGELDGDVFTPLKTGEATVNCMLEGEIIASVSIAVVGEGEKIPCRASEHSFVGSGGFVCEKCSASMPALYTGPAESADGRAMFIINGKTHTGWLTLGRDTYLFGADGRATVGSVTIDGHTYVFGSDGVMTSGAIEPFNGRYIYYIGTNGENGETVHKLQRGWYKVGGDWYFFNNQSTNFAAAKGETVLRDNNSYTFSSSCVLTTGAWNSVRLGTSYFWGPDCVSGFWEIGGSMYYFDPQTTYMYKNGDYDIYGLTAKFDESGKFQHYGEHQHNENGVCTLCRAEKFPQMRFYNKLLYTFARLKAFFNALFGIG